MAEHSAGAGEPRWLLEPRPGEVQIHVAVGEGATLTPELRVALEALASALHQEEVAGYAKPQPCPSLEVCPSQYGCEPRMDVPCAMFTSCRIAD